jgi:phage terminase small subunit
MTLDDCALAPRLDPVRERFVQEYHATGNASEAYRRSNPKALKW